MLAALARRAVRLVLWVGMAAVGLVAALAAGFAAQAWWRLPDLAPWHRIALDEEYTRDRRDIADFEAYLALEQRLFAALEQRVLGHPDAQALPMLARYRAGSEVARLAAGDGNRSSVVRTPDGRGAVLLIHGLSDAPYSMHAIGRTYRALGYHVVSLRLPGHGTVPAALTRAQAEDWSAAVSLAARQAAALAGADRPWHIAGYSTGGALALDYALAALERDDLPRPSQLLLFSPAIGLAAGAGASRVADAFAFLPPLEKARWMDVLPEYDPYKYNSFPVNAAKQIVRLTDAVDARLHAAAAAGRLERLPQVTAFVSIVDATVSAPDVVARLFARLPARGHELVVFDVNRSVQLAGLIDPSADRHLALLDSAPAWPFRLVRIGNRAPGSAELVAWVRPAGAPRSVPEALGLDWPAGLVSLGHLALTLPASDPLYGLQPELAPGQRFTLGGPPPRGEGGAMVVSLATLARPRSNPFFPVVERRIAAAIATDAR